MNAPLSHLKSDLAATLAAMDRNFVRAERHARHLRIRHALWPVSPYGVRLADVLDRYRARTIADCELALRRFSWLDADERRELREALVALRYQRFCEASWQRQRGGPEHEWTTEDIERMDALQADRDSDRWWSGVMQDDAA